MKMRLGKAVAAFVGGVALITPIAVTSCGTGVAGANSTQVSPVGSYNVTIVGLIDSTLNIRANGHFGFPGGPQGTWTETTKSVVHMTGTLGAYSYVFAISQLGTNLGSAAKPGSVKLNGKAWAKWYAVRT